MKIFKYPLQPTDRQTVNLPAGAKVLSVGVQGIQLCLWALVDQGAPTIPREFIIHGTGHPADDVLDTTFVGTVLLHEGALILHIFEVPVPHDA